MERKTLSTKEAMTWKNKKESDQWMVPYLEEVSTKTSWHQEAEGPTKKKLLINEGVLSYDVALRSP